MGPPETDARRRSRNPPIPSPGSWLASSAASRWWARRLPSPLAGKASANPPYEAGSEYLQAYPRALKLFGWIADIQSNGRPPRRHVQDKLVSQSLAVLVALLELSRWLWGVFTQPGSFTTRSIGKRLRPCQRRP